MSSRPVEQLLEDIRLVDEQRHTLVQRLRRLVLATDPAVSEEVKYGGLLFSAGPPFCGIFSYSRHVALEFGRGAELADPHQVLEGSGKLRRHIKLVVDGDLYKKNVGAYVRAAFEAALQAEARRGKPRGRG